MKKLLLLAVLIASLSVVGLAEGGIPIGGLTETPCSTDTVDDGGIPIGGITAEPCDEEPQSLFDWVFIESFQFISRL